MHPLLLRIGFLSAHTYGLMMAVGVGFGLWFIYVQAKKIGLNPDQLMDASFLIVLVALVGAKLILLVGDFSYYLKFPGELLSLARSGGVFQGGLTAGVIFGIWYLHKKKIPLWPTTDIIGAAVALGHGFGRIGCFLAGCCYGRACDVPWGVTYHDEYAHELTGIPLGVRMHPVQLYESALNFLNFVILWQVLKRKKYDGQVFSLYIINYSVIRFFTEYFRGDHDAPTYLLRGDTPLTSLSLPQFYCLLGLAGGIILAGILKKRRQRV